jgi:hypothetical protein
MPSIRYSSAGIERRPTILLERFQASRRMMKHELSGVKVTGYEHLISTVSLPDPETAASISR